MTPNDELVALVEAHERFQSLDRCIEAAWAAAHDQQPDHLTDLVVSWFVGTAGYDEVFEP